MFPSLASEAMASEALLREASHINPATISTWLSAAGFDGIPQNGPFLLGAMALGGGAENGLTRELGISAQEASQMIDTLVEHGYLRSLATPDGSGRTVTVITSLGRSMLAAAISGVMAARWADFPFREGDIVISTPIKSGTTWIQMICALLIFQTPDLPAPLSKLSPWMDSEANRRGELYARLAAQGHRRFIKTHVPLNDMTIDPRATYIVIARHPLDSAISLYHQNHNVLSVHPEQRARWPEPDPHLSPREAEHKWLLRWASNTESLARPTPTSMPGVLRHLSDAWARRTQPNVILLHYEDLTADLDSEMRGIAARLGVTVPDAAWPVLVQAATFDEMRAAADQIQPLDSVLTDHAAFFRKGTSGSGRELLTEDELACYYARAAQLAPPDLLSWLHRHDAPNGESPAR